MVNCKPMPSPNRQAIPRWAGIAICCCTLIAYPLSYAPLVRIKVERHGTGWGSPLFYDGRDMPVYQPIDWLIDNTPLDKPMFGWACLWGVESEFQMGALLRLHPACIPMIDPPVGEIRIEHFDPVAIRL